MPTHTNSWSNAAPADADDINQGAAEMRKFRLDVDERMDVDHDWPATTDGGYHTAVHLKEQGADPASVANVGVVYTKDESGVTIPYYIDSAGTVTKLVYQDEGYRQLTATNGGFWGNVIWKDADEVIIKAKPYNGLTAFHGCILSNGKFIKGTADITVQLPAGGSADGITAPLNNEWYILWGYEDAGGALAYCITWMPKTTFSTNNPTNTLTLNQVNTQDIGLLFNPNADLLVWNASAKFETWRYNTSGGSTPTGACYLSSRTSTVLTLDGALAVNNFSANDQVAQLNNFKPLAVDDGLIVDIIGARGYKDTGVRVRTNATGGILPFTVTKSVFAFANGTEAADSAFAYSQSGIYITNLTNAYAAYYFTYIPPDKKGLFWAFGSDGGAIYHRQYFLTYGELLNYEYGANSVPTSNPADINHIHPILSLVAPAGLPDRAGVGVRGYYI